MLNKREKGYVSFMNNMDNDLYNFADSSRDLTLLFVEDNIEARKMTASILKEFFHTIIEAEDGIDGIDKFKKNKIDIVITDINMPNMNGLELIRQIKQINKKIPVILLSAHSDTKYFLDAIEQNVDGYILKPIEVDQLISVIKKSVDKIITKRERKKYYNLLIQYQDAIDKSAIVAKYDIDGTITYVNDEFCKLTQYSKEELIGKNYSMLKHPDTPEYVYRQIFKTLYNNKSIWKGILRNIKKNGQTYYVNTVAKPILNENGDILEYITLSDDISDIMNPNKQLHDFIDLAKNPFVAMIKIEGFENINKIYGHNFVQQLEDKAGGDFFRLLPKECNFKHMFQIGFGKYVFVKDKYCDSECIECMKKCLSEYQKTLDSYTVNVLGIDYNIPVVLSFAHKDNVIEDANLGIEKLINEKGDIIDATGMFENQKEEVEKNIRTVNMIKKALQEDRIILHFQPIINNSTQKIEKYEALVRIIDEQGKILTPYFFLDIAKKSRYYNQITSKVLNSAFDTFYNIDKSISANISILDIENKDTRNNIYSIINKNLQYCNRIIFELLEDEASKDFELVRDFIKSMKEKGIKIAIDDFGSGYSNFRRILDLEPDILKIDGSLVKNIEHDELSLSIVKTIVNFAKSQNIQTVAEFVENKNIYKILNDIGVDFSQGYYFGKPDVLK